MTPDLPTATYRLQLHAGFTFDAAAEVVPYLARLGISHVYLSPVLTAVPGSVHGYDVLDHASVNPELGGRPGLERLVAVCREHGLGVVLDIVPNHMALVAPEWTNRQVWQVLQHGRRAPTAHWFDVDWGALDGRFGLPVLGAPLGQVLAEGELTLDVGGADEGPAAGEPVLRYYHHVFPVAPGTAAPAEDPAQVLERQHYLLACWRQQEVLNYRRFFEVDGLIGVRVEFSDVFERTHRELLDLHHHGLVDGFRVDHPDGLADPHGYLAMLARHCRPDTPIWVEKILEGGERLPQDWACAGTTGYDAGAALTTALVDPGGSAAVDAAWVAAGGEPDLAVVVEAAKREVAADLLSPELDRLTRLAQRVLPHAPVEELRPALVEVLVALHVYRAYVRPGHTSAAVDQARLAEAVEHAASARPDLDSAVRSLGQVLLAPETYGHDPVAGRDLAVRFQQVTGPVMAKGIEDTAFYRWHRLVARNEVGADPAAPADPATLHTWAVHQARHWPRGMTTLSTHDTKRSEDVRARLLALAGDPEAWARCSQASAVAAREAGVDGPTAHLLWQTLAGAGEIEEERLVAYLTKAMREDKTHTSWVDVDEAYEARVLGLAREALAGPPGDVVRDAVAAAQADIRALTLAQKLLQLTLPGVPDTYQGGELVDLSLVDPDNRRAVDYADRRARLARLDDGGEPADLADEKLLVTATALRLRRRLPEPFAGDYRPLEGGEHLLGFVRGGLVAVLAVRGAASLAAAGGFAEESVVLPGGRWVDELTGRDVAGGRQHLAELLDQWPVALLVRADDETPSAP